LLRASDSHDERVSPKVGLAFIEKFLRGLERIAVSIGF
jgi:hypothetical protein